MIYVMSDIHGNMDRFNSILKQINLKDDDTLYILGDVVDRYPDGIKILNKIMKMPNVKMLLGNHEYMMLKAIGEENTDEWDKQYRLNLWYRNGGEVTHKHIKHMRKNYRKKIFDFLKSLPVNIDIEVNGIKYKLVHGSPVEHYYVNEYNSHRYENEIEFAVWERWGINSPVPTGATLIFGHTPTTHFSKAEPWSIWKNSNAIGIDCGSGYIRGRLGCLRLDDMKEFYSEPENYQSLNWTAYRYNINKKEFEQFNIFEHINFFEKIVHNLKTCKTKEEFSKSVDLSLRYYFWCRSEYEVVLINRDGRIIMTPWIGKEDLELDMTDDKIIDWMALYNHKKRPNDNGRIKIDVYDQVSRWHNEFMDYIWDVCKK